MGDGVGGDSGAAHELFDCFGEFFDWILDGLVEYVGDCWADFYGVSVSEFGFRDFQFNSDSAARWIEGFVCVGARCGARGDGKIRENRDYCGDDFGDCVPERDFDDYAGWDSGDVDRVLLAGWSAGLGFSELDMLSRWFLMGNWEN